MPSTAVVLFVIAALFGSLAIALVIAAFTVGREHDKEIDAQIRHWQELPPTRVLWDYDQEDRGA